MENATPPRPRARTTKRNFVLFWFSKLPTYTILIRSDLPFLGLIC
jgi:hypothetical protein